MLPSGAVSVFLKRNDTQRNSFISRTSIFLETLLLKLLLNRFALEAFFMRLFSLILWLSSLFCAFPSFAQDHVGAAPVSDDSPREYNERWAEVGSKCITTLITRAKLKRNQIWNKRFPNLKTLCIEFERYWYLTNLYADGVGISRNMQDTNWIKSALASDTIKIPCSALESDLIVIQQLRKDFNEFSGSSSTKLVDSATLRFNPGQLYTLDGDKTPPVAETVLHGQFYFPTMGDYWPSRKRFWGDPGIPGSRE